MNAAKNTRSQLNHLRGMFTMDMLMESMPDGADKPSDMKSQGDFLVLYAAFLEKKNLQDNAIAKS